MEKFYKLMEEVCKYISSEKDKYLQLPMEEWLQEALTLINTSSGKSDTMS